MTSAALRVALVVAGAAAASATWSVAARNRAAYSPRWARTNFRGAQVSLLGGPVAAVVAAAGCLVTAGLSAESRRPAVAVVVVLLFTASAGIYDDLTGDASARGLAGHLRALARGRVTSGGVKIAALAAGGLAAAAVLHRDVSAQVLVDGALIAASANLANLFDLRPGRAAKVVAACLLLVVVVRATATAAFAWCAGVTAGLLPADVRERLMLGDGGANALGGVCGVALVVALTTGWRAVALAVVVGLTLSSELVSFTRVIESTPPLRWLDHLGRRPDERARA